MNEQLDEKWQMIIFDILEGNLPEAEKQSYMKEIEQSPALMHEFNLFKSTYLSPEEEILFGDKGSLFQFHPLAIKRNNTIRYAVAASLLLMASAGAFNYFSNRVNHNPNFSLQANKGAIPVPNTVKPETQTGKNIVRNNRHDGGGILPNQKVTETQAEIENTVFTSPDLAQIMSIAPQSLKPQFLSQEAITTAYSITMIPEQIGPSGFGKRRSLTYRLLNKSKTMLANLSLPEIKLKAIKSENTFIPTIQMNIKTKKEEIIAQIID